METLIKTLNEFFLTDTWARICDRGLWVCIGLLVGIPIAYWLAKLDYRDCAKAEAEKKEGETVNE